MLRSGLPEIPVMRGGIGEYPMQTTPEIAVMRNLSIAILLFLTALAPSLRAEDSFTIAVVPDTQQEVLRANDTRFVNRIQWVLANRTALNIKLLAQVGDLLNWDTPDHIQYQRASAGLQLLDDARLPYVLTIGNHDTAATKEGGSAAPGNVHDNQRNTTTFNSFFPISRHQIVRGVFEPGKIDNAYHTFSAGDLDWLVINVELWPRASAVAWVKSILAAHPHHNGIIVTHSYLNGDSTVYGGNGGYGDKSPQYLWEEALKHNANMRMVWCGHVGTHGYRTDTGVNGNTVYSFLQNYADNTNNQVRLLEIGTKAGTIKSRIHVPITNTTLNDGSTFTVNGVSWVQRAAPVTIAPSITAQPVGKTVLVGQTAAFSVTATGTPAPTYQWQRNGADISGATAPSYTTPSTAIGDNGSIFRCVITNSAGSATSANAVLTVSAGDPVIGTGSGLAGAYFGNQDLTGPVVLRTDARVDFTWTQADAPVPGIDAATYAIRWAGQVQAQFSQTYTFSVLADDGVRLWVDGRLLVDQWRDQATTEYSGSVALVAGNRYDIAIEYYQVYGEARIALAWSSPSTAKQVIPASQLYPAGTTAPWSAQDVGSWTKPGSSYVIDDTVVVTGAGGDIYKAADGGRIATQPLTGDGSIVARVVSMQGTNPWAKAGVMIREGTAAGAKHAFCFITPGNGVGFIRRTAVDGMSTYTPGSRSTVARWLRLVRSGSTITAAESADGSVWTVVGTVSVALGNPVQVGFAVTSGDNSKLCTAVFDQVRVTPSGNG